MIHIHCVKNLWENDKLKPIRAELFALPAPDEAGFSSHSSIVQLYNDEDHIIDLEQATNQLLGLSTDKETKVFFWYRTMLGGIWRGNHAFIAVGGFDSADHEWAEQEARYQRWTVRGACRR